MTLTKTCAVSISQPVLAKRQAKYVKIMTKRIEKKILKHANRGYNTVIVNECWRGISDSKKVIKIFEDGGFKIRYSTSLMSEMGPWYTISWV